MERRFGYNLSRVRIHTDSPTADAIGAKAFASGHHIWFSSSHSPSSHELLAHELAHVVEQTTGTTRNEHRDGTVRPQLKSPPHTIGVTQFDFQADVLRELHRLPSDEEPGISDAERDRRERVILARRQRLRVHFRGLADKEAGKISDRLHKRKAGDVLSERFHDILHTATRNEMLTILTDTIADSHDSVDDFCIAYSAAELRALKDIQADRAMNELVDDYIAIYYGAEVAEILKQYLSGFASTQALIFDDPAHRIVQAFADNDVTRNRQEHILTAFEKNLSKNCPSLPANVWTDVDVSSVVPKSELNAAFSFSGPRIPTIPGVLAGGVSGSDFGVDSRSISGKVQMLRIVVNGVTTSVQLLTKFRFIVRDAFDFCPGDMGGFFARTMTVPMSRLEASGFVHDVPFEVHYDGPTSSRSLDSGVVQACFRP